MSDLQKLIRRLHDSRAWKQKQQLQTLAQSLTSSPQTDRYGPIRGDDAAVIPRDHESLLLASELILPELVEHQPRFAGRSAVLANVNDIYAMGGRPLALQNVILSTGTSHLESLYKGLQEGARRYDCSITGGHLTVEETSPVLGAFVLGTTSAPLRCTNARAGDDLLMAVHLQGDFETEYAFWNGTGHRSDRELRQDLDLLPRLAESGHCRAARDISMAGIIGSVLMLMEPPGLGGVVDLNAIPCPSQARNRLFDWLTTFPSYGFLLAVHPDHTSDVRQTFHDRDIACEIIGQLHTEPRVWLRKDAQRSPVWDFEQTPFTGFNRRPD